MYKVQPR